MSYLDELSIPDLLNINEIAQEMSLREEKEVNKIKNGK